MMIPKPKHKRRVPTQRQRNNFNAKVRKEIFKDADRLCRSCGRRATQIHHVMPRGRGGRGVYSNGMATCSDCHRRMHQDNNLLQFWISKYEEKYGKGFYKDEWD